MIKIDILRDALSKYEVSLSKKQLDQFELYESYLKDYNNHTNLVSSNDIGLIWEKHIIDSISFCRYIKRNFSGKIIDIGSGGGFPVIAEAIILTNSKIFALDSTAKKTKFLENVKGLLKLNNLSVINDRAETISYKKSFREKFDIVTSRAVGNLAQISELALPFLKIGGKFIAYKSAKLNEEISQGENAIKILGGEIKDIYEYQLTLNENFIRNLVLIEKINDTPPNYPRSFSVIKNKPL